MSLNDVKFLASLLTGEQEKSVIAISVGFFERVSFSEGTMGVWKRWLIVAAHDLDGIVINKRDTESKLSEGGRE
jgi:hypothetical protein